MLVAAAMIEMKVRVDDVVYVLRPQAEQGKLPGNRLRLCLHWQDERQHALDVIQIPALAQGAALDAHGDLWIAASEGPKKSFLYRVDRKTGAIRVRRVACAHDCGLVVNPDALRMQIEGSILQTISRTLHEEVAFDRSRVTSVDWASYPILTFPEVPAIAIDLVARPKEPPLGAGEAAATPVGAALANAVFDACGARLRTVPFTRERVLAAIS